MEKHPEILLNAVEYLLTYLHIYNQRVHRFEEFFYTFSIAITQTLFEIKKCHCHLTLTFKRLYRNNL